MHPDREIVGLLAGPSDRRATAYLPARNRAWDEPGWAEGARDRFEVDAAEALRLLEAVWKDDLTPVAWVHSHPHGTLAPSERDRAGGWSDLLTVVVAAGPFAAGPVRLRAHRIGPAKGHVPSPAQVVPLIRPALPCLGHQVAKPPQGIDVERVRRQMALPEIGEAGQERLARARVLILGVGGLGSPAALYLSRTGLGTLALSDFDQVDVTNLGRQILFGEADVGSPKVEVAARRLRSDVGEGLRVRAEPAITEARAAVLLGRYDVIVHGTDLYSVRDLVNRTAVRLGLTWVDASVYRWTAQVMVYRPQGPCYRCLYPSLPEEGAVDACDIAGVPGPVTGVAGTLEALSALKIVAGIDPPSASPRLGSVLLWDGLRDTFDTMRAQRRPACPVCGRGEQPGKPAQDGDKDRGRDRSKVREPAGGTPSVAPASGEEPLERARMLGLTVSAEDAATWPGPVFDLRPTEWQRREPLPGVRSLPLPRVVEMLDALDGLDPKRGPALLVCMRGFLSAELALAVREGHPEVRCLDGGAHAFRVARERGERASRQAAT